MSRLFTLLARPLFVVVGLIALSLSFGGCTTPAPVEEEPILSEEEIAEQKRRLAEKMPRVMMIVDEKSLGTIPTAEVEAMAVKKLLENNVRVVDQDMVRANVSKDQQLLKMAGDNRGAAALGLQYGADVIIIGEAVAKPSARRIADSNLRTYQAVATLRAVRTDNSSTIASSSESSSVIDVDDASGSSKALKMAGAKSLDAIIPAMLDAWEAGGAPAGTVTHVVMTVGGVDQMWKLKAIRESLQAKTDKARNVRQKSYTAGVAVFEADSTVPVEEFAEFLVLSPPNGLKIQVLNIESGKIDLKAVAAN